MRKKIILYLILLISFSYLVSSAIYVADSHRNVNSTLGHGIYVADSHRNVNSTLDDDFFLLIPEELPSQLNVTSNLPADLAAFQTFDTVDIIFNFTASDIQIISACSLLINQTVNQTLFNVDNNSVVTNFPSVTFGFDSGSIDRQWSVNCSAFDDTEASSLNRTFTVISFPSELKITSVSPLNNSVNLTLELINFTFTASSIRAIPACSLRINNTVNQTLFSVSNDSVLTSFIPLGFVVGDYNWDVNCSDYIGGENVSENRLLFIEPIIFNVQLCPNMTNLVFSPDISFFNITTNSLTQFNVTPVNTTFCGWVFNITSNIDRQLQVKLNTTIGENYSLEYNEVNVSSVFITIANITRNVQKLINVTLDYIAAIADIGDFNDTFQFI